MHLSINQLDHKWEPREREMTKMVRQEGRKVNPTWPHLTPILAAQLTAPPWANCNENILEARGEWRERDLLTEPKAALTFPIV